MSEPYACEECPYATNNHRSFKLHSIQCPALLRHIKENEELLQHKRNASADSGTLLDHFRPSKLARNDSSRADQDAHGSLPVNYAQQVDQDGFAHPNNPSNTESGPSSQHPNASSTAPNLPAYQPLLGRFRDENDALPEAPPAPNPANPMDTPTPRIRRVILRVRPEPVPYTTSPDTFGQYRIYSNEPQTIPDSACELEDLSDIRSSPNPQLPVASRSMADIILPCPNISAFRLQHWHWNEGVKKSESARESLVRDVISQPDFIPSDISKVKWGKLDDALASYVAEPASRRTNTMLPLSVPPRTPAAAAHYVTTCQDAH